MLISLRLGGHVGLTEHPRFSGTIETSLLFLLLRLHSYCNLSGTSGKRSLTHLCESSGTSTFTEQLLPSFMIRLLYRNFSLALPTVSPR